MTPTPLPDAKPTNWVDVYRRPAPWLNRAVRPAAGIWLMLPGWRGSRWRRHPGRLPDVLLLLFFLAALMRAAGAPGDIVDRASTPRSPAQRGGWSLGPDLAKQAWAFVVGAASSLVILLSSRCHRPSRRSRVAAIPS
jgi:hypothetical protein